jgi:hypothetical protein
MTKETIERSIKQLLDYLQEAITEEHILRCKQGERVHLVGDFFLANVCEPAKPTRLTGCFIKDIRRTEDGYDIDILYTNVD